MKTSRSKGIFRDAASLQMLRSIISASCDNLHGKKYRDEVVELYVSWDLRPGDVPKHKTGTWMRVIPIREHSWPCCAVLLLEVADSDARPNPDLRVPVEVPRNKILLSAHWLYDAAINKLSHCSSLSNRLILLLPTKAGDGDYAPAVIRDLELDEDGEGSKLILDLAIVDDLDELARYFGPPFFGFVNV